MERFEDSPAGIAEDARRGFEQIAATTGLFGET